MTILFAEGVPEVPLEDAPQPIQVLHVQGAVESHLMPEALDGVRRRLPAQDQVGWVAKQTIDQTKNGDREEEGQRNEC